MESTGGTHVETRYKTPYFLRHVGEILDGRFIGMSVKIILFYAFPYPLSVPSIEII